jgi:hypothetical protein
MEFEVGQEINILYKAPNVTKDWKVIGVTTQLVILIDNDGMEFAYRKKLFEIEGPLQATLIQNT